MEAEGDGGVGGCGVVGLLALGHPVSNRHREPALTARQMPRFSVACASRPALPAVGAPVVRVIGNNHPVCVNR
jgi:hypothetical protein